MSSLTSLDGLAATPPRAASGTRLAVRRFLRNRLAVVGLGVVVFFVLF